MNKKRTGCKIVSWSAVPSATLVSSKLVASWEGLTACWEGLRPSWMVLRAVLEGLGGPWRAALLVERAFKPAGRVSEPELNEWAMEPAERALE